MSKTKVLICIPNLHGGGAERVALQLFRGLDRDSFSPVLFIHERQGALLRALEGDTRDIIFQHDEPYRRGHLLGSLRGTIAAARRADVIIGANEGRAAFLAILAARITGKPLILWLHTNWTEFRHKVSWRQMFALRQFNRADAIVACSDGASAAFADIVPQGATKLSTIRNGSPIIRVQAQALEPVEPQHEALFDRPVVVNVGRLSPEKGHDILIRAHALLREQGVDHRLMIVGEGDLRGNLLALAEELAVSDTVHLLGFQDNPYRYVARATVFALSSRIEGFPLVLVEAMACGTPIVASDCPSGPREVLEDGAYGPLVPVENPAALAEALGAVLRDPAERARLSALVAGRARDFDIGAMVEEWEGLIRSVRRD